VTLRARVLFSALLALVAADASQRWAYVALAPTIQDVGDWRNTDPSVRAILVAGYSRDPAERATELRDLAQARQTLEQLYPSRLRTRSFAPVDSIHRQDAEAALHQVGRRDELVVYLTGHGGGHNFGCGRLNITREQLAAHLPTCADTTVIIDCCYSGEFSRAVRATLITSTDAGHESPFPVSYLGPRSFGSDFFTNWARTRDVASAFVYTDRQRARWAWLYPSSITTRGELKLRQSPPDEATLASSPNFRRQSPPDEATLASSK
jgi:hypothetical protein